MTGGAIYAYGQSVVFATDSYFKGNLAKVYGGAIAMKDGYMVLTSSLFEYNSAADSGGAIYLDDVANAWVCCNSVEQKVDRAFGLKMKLKQIVVTPYPEGFDFVLALQIPH